MDRPQDNDIGEFVIEKIIYSTFSVILLLSRTIRQTGFWGENMVHVKTIAELPTFSLLYLFMAMVMCQFQLVVSTHVSLCAHSS